MTDHRTPRAPGPDDELLVTELRDSFETLAVAYEPQPLPGDLWQQGRREGRSARLQLVAASAVLLALLAGTLAWGRVASVGPADDGPEGGALPRVMHVPAYDQVQRMVADGEVARSLDVGPLSMTTVLDGWYVLGVDAHHGRHLLLDLPQLDRVTGSAAQAVSLSPDGRFLAWPYLDPSEPRGETSGVRVVDLTTGRSSDFRATGPTGLPVRVWATAWSTDGGQLGFTGTEYVPAEGIERSTVAGVVDPESSAPGSTVALETVALKTVALETGWASSVAVADDGTLHVVASGEGHLRLDPGASEPVVVGAVPDTIDEPLGAALAPEGDRLVVGGDSAVDLGAWELPTDADGPTPRARAWPVDSSGSAMPVVRVRGWTPLGGVLGQLGTADQQQAVHRLAPDGTARLVVEIRAAETSFDSVSLSVANDLGDVTPVDFPTPDWTQHPLRPWGTALGALAALAVLVALARAARRVRSRRDAGRVDVPLPVGVREVNDLADALRGARSLLTRRPSGRVVDRGVRTLGLLALAGALAATLAPMQPRPDGPVVAEGALPVRAHAPTGWAAAGNSQAAAIDRDTPPGPLSVLIQDSFAAHVGVSGSDGAHLILPPASDWMEHVDFVPRLSPDGTRLADLWVERGDTTVATEAGMAVTDLRTGEVTRVSLRGPNDRPVRITEVSWSADGSHLAWFGDEAVQWDDGGSAFKGPRRMVGVTGAGDLRATSWLVGKGDVTAAVAAAPDGTGHLLVGRRLFTFRSDAPTAPLAHRTVAPVAMQWSGAAVSGNGRTLAVGLDARSAYASGLRLLDLTADDSRLRPLAWQQRDPMVLTHALGFTPVGRLVVAGQSARSLANGGDRLTQVAVVEPDGLTGSGTAPRLVTEVESAAPDLVSVATDLADRAPVAFAPPRWPTSIERKAQAGVLAAVLVLWLVSDLRRRQRQRRGRTA